MVCTLRDPAVPALAAELGTTRSAAALELWGDRLDGAVVAIGNAPTALFRLLEMVAAGAPRPAAVLGIPVGFIGAAESKDALAASDLEYLVVRGRRGGSAITAAAVNALASDAGVGAPMNGRLYGVGLGPGDPELVTVKAARLIAAADVVAYHAAAARAQQRAGDRRAVPAAGADRGGADLPGHHRDDRPSRRLPGRDRRVLRRARRAGSPRTWTPAATWWCWPRATRSSTAPTCTCTSGWPTGTRPRSCPGVTSVSAAAAVLGRPLVERDEVLTVLPGTLPPTELAARLAGTDSAAVMKLGRTFAGVREALERAGRLDDAWYVERATTDRRAHRAAGRGRPGDRAVLLARPAAEPGGRDVAAVAARAEAADSRGRAARSWWSGSGPATREWLTPEARAALAAADDLVGYGPYLDRVPPDPRQRRHASDNRVEAERAAFALDLAKRGRRVAVVSSGDPGVFAMAAAVLEVAEDPQWKDVPVRVAARADRGAGGGQPGRRAARPRLLRAVAVRPAQAVGGHRGPARPRRPRPTWCIAIYNPASKTPHLAAGPGPCAAAASTARRRPRW